MMIKNTAKSCECSNITVVSIKIESSTSTPVSQSSDENVVDTNRVCYVILLFSRILFFYVYHIHIFIHITIYL